MHHLQLINKHRRMETLDGSGLGIAREYIDNKWGWLIFVKHSEKNRSLQQPTMHMRALTNTS